MNGEGFNIPAGDGQFRAAIERTGRQILCGNFARLSRQELDVIVFPQDGEDLQILHFAVNAQPDLKREVIAGISKCNVDLRTLLSLCDSGSGRDSNAGQSVELREVVVGRGWGVNRS